MYGEAPLSDDTIRAEVIRSWGLEIQTLEYSAVGYGSFHWRAIGAGGDWFVTLDRPGVWPVVDAYDTARALGSRLQFVRAPATSVAGDVVVDVQGWWLSLWPWVTGRTEDGFVHTDTDLSAVLVCLRELHAVTDLAPLASLTEDWQLPAIDRVSRLVDEAERWDRVGPYAADVSQRVVANSEMLQERVGRYLDLVRRVGNDCPFVITHGEPHPGNVVHGEGGVVMIDWDTLRWAPKERDLWMFGDPAHWQSGYGTDVSADACEVYRLQWFLTEMADFVPDLVAARERSADLDVAFEEVQRVLPL